MACPALLRDTRRRVAELGGVPPLTPDGPEWYAQMAALPLPACDLEALSRRLQDEYHIEVPLLTWNGSHTGSRVRPGVQDARGS